jgi:hypothetical protein
MVIHVASEIRPLPAWVNVDDVSCLAVQKASIRNMFSQMVDIAEAAYSRTTNARTLLIETTREDQVVFRTLETYFLMSQASGARGRLTKLIGRSF